MCNNDHNMISTIFRTFLSHLLSSSGLKDLFPIPPVAKVVFNKGSYYICRKYYRKKIKKIKKKFNVSGFEVASAKIGNTN